MPGFPMSTPAPYPQHLLTLSDWPRERTEEVLALAVAIKRSPRDFAHELTRRTLLMVFEKPSLRTRLSFETGMTRLGGHAIYYDTRTSPLGSGKESISDTVKVASRYVDLIMARLFEHADLEEMAAASDVPVINALTNFSHPCQILADLLTIQEKKGALAGLKLAFVGDGLNNITHSLLTGCSRMGLSMAVGCPEGKAFRPAPAVVAEAREEAEALGQSVVVTGDPAEAVAGADIVYVDSWMSYHIPAEERDARVATLRPYQVDAALMAQARPDAIFMNCLPAMRGFEQTAEVIDGPQSVVFDQAENRMHVQNAIMVKLLEWRRA